MNIKYIGQTYEVKDLLAYDLDDKEVIVSGRYTVEEYEAEDRSVGIMGDFFWIVKEEDIEGASLTVDPYVLLKQIDPEYIKREEEMEKQMAEDAEREREVEKAHLEHERRRVYEVRLDI